MAGGREDGKQPGLPRIRRRASRLAGEGVALGWAASERLADGVIRAVRTGRRLVGDPTVLRARRLRRLNRQPLPNLWDVHPEAHAANARELGLRSVPLDEIAGTAVAGAAQRGSDFLPLPPSRSANWRGRWRRIRAAVERLELLPPIDLLKFGGRYWVTDGHNRVAAALYSGQVDIDAVVTALVSPGASLDEAPASLAELASDSFAVRAAGSGRWTAAGSPGAMDEASSVMDRAPKARGGRRDRRDAAPRPDRGTVDEDVARPPAAPTERSGGREAAESAGIAAQTERPDTESDGAAGSQASGPEGPHAAAADPLDRPAADASGP